MKLKLGTFLFATLLSGLAFEAAFAGDKVIIISPHRKSIQEEFVPKFKEYYKAKYKADVEVEWIDQGGTSDDIRFVSSKFSTNPKTSGIDIFWGGGASAFVDLAKDTFLAEYKLPADLKKQLPEKIAGVAMYDATQTWYGSAASSFGIFTNKKLLKIQRTEAPKIWADLANPKFEDQISATDPRHSGGAAIMNTIILQGYGWDKGWEILGNMAANVRKFTHSSSDPIKAVVSGDVSLAPTIDFYAAAKIGDLGAENLGFVLPTDFSVLDPDPVAILKGAPNRKVAERFMEFVLSADAQKLLVLPKGQAGGPVKDTLGRMAVNKDTYNQVQLKSISANPLMFKTSFTLDAQKAAKLKNILNDLIGAIHIDIQNELKTAVKNLRKKGAKPAEISALLKPPMSEKEALALADKWDDDVFRNKTINTWINDYKSRYIAASK
ncbi:MAG: extracellular solute-binding protein [Pseudomonadota bacterium]